MFDEKLLRELAALEAAGPVLSVYLNVDPTQHTADEYKLILRDLLKHAEGKVDEADIEAVKRYVSLEYDWSGRGLVLFSRQAEELWYAFSLPIPVPSGVTVARKPYISPLVELDGLYGRYAVALVDRRGARLFLFQMGELMDQNGVLGDELHGPRKGGGSSRVGTRSGAMDASRKDAEVVQRNLRDVAEELIAFCQEYQPRRLLLAGAEPTVAQFQDVLPTYLQDVIAGTFNADMDENPTEIQERSLAILQNLNEQRKKALVETVITTAAKGGNGVLRLDDTMSAGHEGRIQVLVLERNYHEVGYHCTQCGYLTTQTLDACPFCNGSFEQIADAAEAIVTQVIDKGGSVQVVDNGMLGDARIGALLRY